MSEYSAPVADPPKPPGRKRMAGDVVRFVTGAILLFAAGMKGYELATGRDSEISVLTSRSFRIVVVEFELALGLCLICGFWTKMTWGASIICFVGFASISAYEAWQGRETCGCFGKTKLDPRLALILDVVVLMALIAFRSESSIVRPEWRRIFLMGAIIFGVGMPSGVLMVRRSSTALDDVENLSSNHSLVSLEPSDLIGKTFPFFKHIDIGKRLLKGKWIVVIYDHNCSHCQATIPKYIRAAALFAKEDDAPRVALVELSPYADVENSAVRHVPCVDGRLDTSHEWFAQAPLEVELLDGVVKFAQEHGDGLTWLKNAQK